LTYRVTIGVLFGSDTLSGALTRAPGEGIGSYPISRGTLSSLNYNLTFVGSTLFIEANPLGMTSPSTLINPANSIPVFPASPPTNVLPSIEAIAAGVDVGQPALKIVTSADGKISLVPTKKR
jgi:MBG domain (YGX type)